MSLRRLQIRVQGIVQGVGFRPFVYRLAHAHQLTGFALNDLAGVLIEIQGHADAVAEFLAELQPHAPPLSRIDRIVSTPQTTIDLETEFRIVASRLEHNAITSVPPDTSPCRDCCLEMADPGDRRFQYPFINCTHCGPRYTIIRDLPYDRRQTTMSKFPLCADCLAEYQDPGSRRFHAEPNACPHCGPTIWFEPSVDVSPPLDVPNRSGSEIAIAATRHAIHSGQIIAIKGIGGFHLAVNAKNSQAVAELRRRKQRGDKPFAVLVADLETAQQIVECDPVAAEILQSPARPIVLLPRRDDTRDLDGVAPNHPHLGVMLAYSPLHRQLIASGEVWVFTSGNLADEPIAFSNHDAWDRLHPLCDGFLFHDRDIETVCDDSVVQLIDRQLSPIRRARGYAPVPIELSEDGPPILALGGELKTTLGLAPSRLAILSQHLGDMGSPATVAALDRCYKHLCRLFRFQPQAIAADLHPNYLSAQWAQRLASELNVPLIGIQHHHAHAMALAVEQRIAEPFIACCFDGTGYGTDGAIWGGEWLIAEHRSFQRVAHLRYVALPGGDAAIHRPARTAVAHGFDAGLVTAADCPALENFNPAEQRLLLQQLGRNLYCTPTSSMGRLFDAVASFCGVRHQVDYEGQAAMELEALAVRYLNTGGSTQRPNFDFTLTEDEPLIVDTRPLIHGILQSLRTGTDRGAVAWQFHHTIAAITCRVCRQIRARWGLQQVGLTGGVFQNQLLVTLTTSVLESAGFQVFRHRLVPPNDGGLALGQLAILRSQWQAT